MHTHDLKAQGNPQAAGPVLERHCATCHVVPDFPAPQRRLGFDAPDFTVIAADPATYTRARLTMILRAPHYPMTTFVLSTVDIDNVVAFILEMQGH